MTDRQTDIPNWSRVEEGKESNSERQKCTVLAQEP